MLDAIKGLTGGGKLQKQADDLERLIAEARASGRRLKHRPAATKSKRSVPRSKRSAPISSNPEQISSMVDRIATLRAELEQVRGVAAQIASDYTGLRDAAREAKEDVSKVVDVVKQVESRLEPLMLVKDLTMTTEEGLARLNALAEHVGHKTRPSRARSRPSTARSSKPIASTRWSGAWTSRFES